MKSEDLQKFLFSKYENGDHPTKIFHDLNGVLGLRINQRWCKLIRGTGSIKLSSPPDRPRTVRTEGTIKDEESSQENEWSHYSKIVQ